MLSTPAWTRTWSIARIAAALLVVAAVVAQLSRTISNGLASDTPHGSHLPTLVANFLSFFTIQSNIAAAVVLVIAAIWSLSRTQDAAPEPRGIAIALACVTTYMIVTGIVYNLLLRGVELPQGVTVAWSNEVLHVVIPLFLVADLFVGPKRRALPWRTLWIVVIYPIVWAVYTLLRANLIIAPATGNSYWYPYPFLDPHLVTGGYLGVVGYIIGIAIAIVAAGACVVWIGRRRGVTVER